MLYFLWKKVDNGRGIKFKTKKDKPMRNQNFKIQQIDINRTKKDCAGCTALTPLPNPLPQGARGWGGLIVQVWTIHDLMTKSEFKLIKKFSV